MALPTHQGYGGGVWVASASLTWEIDAWVGGGVTGLGGRGGGGGVDRACGRDEVYQAHGFVSYLCRSDKRSRSEWKSTPPSSKGVTGPGEEGLGLDTMHRSSAYPRKQNYAAAATFSAFCFFALVSAQERVISLAVNYVKQDEPHAVFVVYFAR